jgi:hypothetical protein
MENSFPKIGLYLSVDRSDHPPLDNFALHYEPNGKTEKSFHEASRERPFLEEVLVAQGAGP